MSGEPQYLVERIITDELHVVHLHCADDEGHEIVLVMHPVVAENIGRELVTSATPAASCARCSRNAKDGAKHCSQHKRRFEVLS
jgi:hypothetical protein